jgi:branched-subunit amino acid ABC-type transport system permease component
MPDPSFLLLQSLNGLTYAMFLFLIASGLSLIFGILGILNFAHGSLYMLGAYFTYQFVSMFIDAPGQFWWAVLFASLTIAALGALIERFFLRHLYGREELYQLLFTYALVLILADLAKTIWGTGQFSVSRPALLKGAVVILDQYFPTYNLVIIFLGPCIAFTFWFALLRTRWGRKIRAAALDREMLSSLGINVNRLFTVVFFIGAGVGGRGGGHQRLYRGGYRGPGKFLGDLSRVPYRGSGLCPGNSGFPPSLPGLHLCSDGPGVDHPALGTFGKSFAAVTEPCPKKSGSSSFSSFSWSAFP